MFGTKLKSDTVQAVLDQLAAAGEGQVCLEIAHRIRAVAVNRNLKAVDRAAALDELVRSVSLAPALMSDFAFRILQCALKWQREILREDGTAR